MNSTELARFMYDRNKLKYNLHYHTWQHIQDCLHFLRRSNVVISDDLMCAVTYHDVVYDPYPDKEHRSAMVAEALHPNLKCVRNIIMATTSHFMERFDTDSEKWMIRADLHGLANPTTAIHNWGLIKEESKSLYKINDNEFAEGNIQFMDQLAMTAEHNKSIDTDFEKFWDNVIRGIDTTRRLSDWVLNS